MKSMRAVAIGIITIGALACATLIVAQQQSAPPRNPLMRDQAVETSSDDLQTGINLAKTVVTAEIVYSSSHGSFVSWDELYRSPDTQKLWQPSPEHPDWPLVQISAGPEVIPGWTLSAQASPDGKSFQVAVHNLADKDKCGLSVYSDESGRVYEGGYVNCIQLAPDKK